MKRELFCPNCEMDQETTTAYRDQMYRVRDRSITIRVAEVVCGACGQAVGSDRQDKEILDAAYAEYRRQTELLTPERIRQIRQRYCLSQKSFAALLGMSEATINRYEQGSLQENSHDLAIRACENLDILRDLFRRRGHLLSDWQRRRVTAAIQRRRHPGGPRRTRRRSRAAPAPGPGRARAAKTR